MTETCTDTVLAALAEVRRIKAPTKRVARIAALLIELPTQAEAELFVRALRVEAKVQDVTLLPETTWTGFESGHRADAVTLTHEELLTRLAVADSIIIDWPSVTFHWGVMVTFQAEGTTFIAQSANYAMTETYMSA